MKVTNIEEYEINRFIVSYELEDGDAEQHLVDYFRGRPLKARSHCTCCGTEIAQGTYKIIEYSRIHGSWCKDCLANVNRYALNGGSRFKY